MEVMKKVKIQKSKVKSARKINVRLLPAIEGAMQHASLRIDR
jgi:hypothetical protein